MKPIGLVNLLRNFLPTRIAENKWIYTITYTFKLLTMSFENSDLFQAINDKQLTTPDRTLTVIKSGCDLLDKGQTSQTYLHHVAKCYHGDGDDAALLPVVYQLSNAGLDVNAVDEKGDAALHLAAATPGARRLVRALLMTGADPQLQNKKG